MNILKSAMAGTLESSDVQIMIEPADSNNGSNIELEVNSSVINQYGRQIKAVVLETLQNMGVKAAKVTVNDRGALDCTIRARTECAVYRASGADVNAKIPWGGIS